MTSRQPRSRGFKRPGRADSRWHFDIGVLDRLRIIDERKCKCLYLLLLVHVYTLASSRYLSYIKLLSQQARSQDFGLGGALPQTPKNFSPAAGFSRRTMI